MHARSAGRCLFGQQSANPQRMRYNEDMHTSDGMGVNMTTLAPKEIATILGVDAKRFREWMRKTQGMYVGSGNHYAIDAIEAARLIAAFQADANRPKAKRIERSVDEILEILNAAIAADKAAHETSEPE
jgi:hypothetical protein